MQSISPAPSANGQAVVAISPGGSRRRSSASACTCSSSQPTVAALTPPRSRRSSFQDLRLDTSCTFSGSPVPSPSKAPSPAPRLRRLSATPEPSPTGWRASPGVVRAQNLDNLVPHFQPPEPEPRESTVTDVPAAVAAPAAPSSSPVPVAPLELASPTGQFLTQILQHYPHLMEEAVDQQLDRLAYVRAQAQAEAAMDPEGDQEKVLRKRINELRASECARSVEDVMYAMIAHRFRTAGASMVPCIRTLAESNGRSVDVGALCFEALESGHSPEALQMVGEHLHVVLGERPDHPALDHRVVAHLSKLRIGQVYAASIMYGYFLRRVDQRYQLEQALKSPAIVGFGEAAVVEGAEPLVGRAVEDLPVMAPGALVENELTVGDLLAKDLMAEIARMKLEGEVKSEVGLTRSEGSGNADVSSEVTWVGGMRGKGGAAASTSKVQAYVMRFDADMLQRCATMRSVESTNLIERHTEALFGRPEVVVDDDGALTMATREEDMVRVSFAGLRKIVLEAVFFGARLWDVETYADKHYPLLGQST